MLICERGCMPDKPAVPRYISPLLPAVKPRGPTPSISRTCTLLGRCECVRALHYVTLPFRTPALSSFNENLEERLVVSRGLEMRVLAPPFSFSSFRSLPSISTSRLREREREREREKGERQRDKES